MTLVTASKRVVSFGLAQAFRYFTVVDQGADESIVLAARDGEYPNAYDQHSGSRIVVWTSNTPDLETASAQPQIVSRLEDRRGMYAKFLGTMRMLPDVAHNYEILKIGENGTYVVFGGRSVVFLVTDLPLT